MNAPSRKLEDSLKSTWRTASKTTWGLAHWMFEIFQVHPTDIKREVPKFDKSDKVVSISVWSGHRWVLGHALWPLALHQLYFWIAGGNPAPVYVWLFYTLAFMLNAISEFHTIRNMAYVFGFLDGDKHDRDQVPDATVTKIFISLIFTASIRPLMAMVFAYKANESPLAMTLWTPIETGLYAITLDFYYYWYHRIMHESETLWKYHRTHHLTKHPNPLLTLFADFEQEIFDAAIIPFMTFQTLRLMGFPMAFFDLWMCHQYIVFTELFGHSGLRIFASPPSTMSWFLQIFDAQLIIEDHDMHHRKGWKTSANYGKQTRLWDTAFGTRGDRIEVHEKNIDPTYTADIPLLPLPMKGEARRG